MLCGECRNGSGVSVLLNRCVTCSDAMGLLVAVLGEKREIVFIVQHVRLIWCCSLQFESVDVCNQKRMKGKSVEHQIEQRLSNEILSCFTLYGRCCNNY